MRVCEKPACPNRRATFLCSVWHDSSNPGTERALHITSPALKGIINGKEQERAAYRIDNTKEKLLEQLQDKRKKTEKYPQRALRSLVSRIFWKETAEIETGHISDDWNDKTTFHFPLILILTLGGLELNIFMITAASNPHLVEQRCQFPIEWKTFQSPSRAGFELGTFGLITNLFIYL